MATKTDTIIVGPTVSQAQVFDALSSAYKAGQTALTNAGAALAALENLDELPLEDILGARWAHDCLAAIVDTLGRLRDEHRPAPILGGGAWWEVG